MPKRRANGEGNIRKRKDGRWEGRYTAGYDPETGKRISYQKVIICIASFFSLPIAAQILRCWGRTSLVTAMRFLNG